MRKILGSDVIRIFEDELKERFIRKKTLFIVLGLLGDFDSFEYIQFLIPFLEPLNKSNINLMVVGIGSEDSKDKFCKYTKFPKQNLRVVNNTIIHRSLNIDSGLEMPVPALLNLIIMCLGIHSPGTLKEVMRGYLGDQYAKSIFKRDDYIKFILDIKIKANLFNVISENGSLRPFELASLRLMNMIEVLSNWSVYMEKESHLTQRSATFLIDDNENILYSYFSKSLLGYSENMSNPLEFLDNYI